MPTTIHIPEDILRDLDSAAERRGVSRNRYIVEACREALAREAGEWPEGMFDPPWSEEDRWLVQEAAEELDREVRARRTNRGAIAL